MLRGLNAEIKRSRRIILAVIEYQLR